VKTRYAETDKPLINCHFVCRRCVGTSANTTDPGTIAGELGALIGVIFSPLFQSQARPAIALSPVRWLAATPSTSHRAVSAFRQRLHHQSRRLVSGAKSSMQLPSAVEAWLVSVRR
jgi:hypothetical protein